MAGLTTFRHLLSRSRGLRERSADAEMLRHRFVGHGYVSGARANEDVVMWRAILLTLLTSAEVAGEREHSSNTDLIKR